MENVVNILLTLDITYNNTQATLGFGTHMANKGAKAIQWRKSSLSTNGTGTTGYSCVEINFNLHITEKLT